MSVGNLAVQLMVDPEASARDYGELFFFLLATLSYIWTVLHQ